MYTIVDDPVSCAKFDKQPTILATKCEGEHVGKLVKDLTLAQIKSLNCAKQLTNHYGALRECHRNSC